ncbi:hypothetical protein COLO4_30179 [Corchorus olitorius]|uniref:Pentacotripeptide-repeat region of PRORP domain-containing protein n=1 Tax=Corchorus olitorius TaxID=93759 RepID=A0A1R3HAK0_9ROSI|nr:hypothetical protein COLO4_30179 [Corchorus olitorius]
MTYRRCFVLSPTDIAVRLNLIHKVHGIEHAENFFHNVSKNLKNYIVYGALLNSYVQEKSIEKAEYIMEKMEEMGMATTSFPYNVLMNLYSQTGAYDRIDMLVQEMDRKGIPQDRYTMRNRMTAAVEVFDISEMESILNQMEDNSNFVVDWNEYSVAASGYLKVGMMDKALLMLKKIETMMQLDRKTEAFEFLLTLYAKTNNKDELYRVWNTYKPSVTIRDTSYCHMITALAELDDLDGAEKMFEEWESQCTMYDFRVLNRLLVAYCKRGLFDKAESVVNKAVEGRTPYASTWQVLAIGFMKHNQMPKAVEMLKKAMSIGREGWRPTSRVFAACLDYLEEQGDVKGVEEMINSCKNSGPLTRDMHHRLLRCRIKAGETVSVVVDQMQRDGFDADKETSEILGSVSRI